MFPVASFQLLILLFKRFSLEAGAQTNVCVTWITLSRVDAKRNFAGGVS